MLYHRLPIPPDKGERIRMYHQVKYLSGRHRLWLACFDEGAQDERDRAQLRQWCHRCAIIPNSRMNGYVRGGWNALQGGTITEGFYETRA